MESSLSDIDLDQEEQILVESKVPETIIKETTTIEEVTTVEVPERPFDFRNYQKNLKIIFSYRGGLHLLQGEYPLFFASFKDIEISLFLKY